MPWYTTADARRDAEKQAASKNRENSVRDNEGPSMNDMEREYRQLCRIDETPGVRGLAQLGRNAIERVAQLEKELAAAVAERDGLGYYRAEFEPIWDGLQDALEGERHIDSYGLGESEVECVRRVLRERDILRARLAEYENAPTVATVCISPSSDFPVLKYSRYDIPQINGAELIARPAKDAP